MTRLRPVFAAVAVLASLLAVVLPARADNPAEAAAQDAIEKSEADYDEKEYATAAARLQAAARDCGESQCAAATKAVVLRNLGIMQVLTDDKAEGVSSFAAALALKSSLTLDPRYDTPDVHAAWNEAKEVALAAGGAEQPKGGDFKHRPAKEQSVNAPVPIYVRYAGQGTVVRVVVKYRGLPTSEWRRLELKRVGAGWGGLVPCGEVDVGVLRYWVQGFDESGDPIGSSGDPEHPYIVPIREEITGERPHLPEVPPPTCADAGCAPGSACDQSKPAATTSPAGPPGAQGLARRLWFGLSGSLDFLSLPSGNDLCVLNSNGKPANASNAYCTTPSGADFPSRASPQQSDSLVRGKAGQLGGGLHSGNFRLMLTADYAIFANWLVGARLGYVFGTYPGYFAVHDGRALGSSVYLEVRATYLFGDDPLSREGFVPMAFAGTGLSEFDGSSGSTATYINGEGQPFTQPVNIWKTDAPWFLTLGGGARYQLPMGVAATGALRLNIVAGGGGLLFTCGPEIGGQYAF